MPDRGWRGAEGSARKVTSARPLAVASLVLLAATCGGRPRDSRRDAGATRRRPGAPAARQAPRPAPFVEHVIQPGETLWDIARAYDLHVEELMEANHLRPRDVRRLRPGDSLRVPGPTERATVQTAADRAAKRAALVPAQDGATHILARGETLWDLARWYDKSVDELMERNDLSDDDVRGLRAGRPIVVPGLRPSRIRHAAHSPRRRTGISHEVVRGETVWDLANAFQVSVSEIMAANGLSTAQVTSLREGEHLFIPGVSSDRHGRVRRRRSGSQRRAEALATRLGMGTRRAASALLMGRPDRRWVRAAGAHPDRLPGTLRWPVTRGRFVRGYGSGEAGYHLAVDIAGDIGWNVRAAAPGIVGYSGNGIRGYGNVVLLVHPGGWVTMYAHNSVNFVVAGQRVPRGGILAEVGSTGISRGPHVHFELMFDGKNCDPGTLFRPGIRHRGGRLTPLAQATWSRRDDRPTRVRCAPRRRYPHSRWVSNE